MGNGPSKKAAGSAPARTVEHAAGLALAHGRHRRAQYRAVSLLGAGAQATVRLATRGDGALYALKTYYKEDGGASSRGAANELAVRNKLKALGHANHPHIVHLVENFVAEDRTYFVFEYAPGTDLAQCLQARGGVLPEWEARRIIASVLGTLSFLHSVGIVHRDVKPANILVRDPARLAETLCLTDFGGAHVSDSPNPANITSGLPSFATSRSLAKAMQSCAGTPLYLPPEIVLGLAYDHKVDSWATGCVLWNLLFGASPFEHGLASFDELYARIMKASLDFPDGGASESCRSFLRALLDPDPSRRPSCAEALDHSWLHEPEPWATPPPTPVAAPMDFRAALSLLDAAQLDAMNATLVGGAWDGNLRRTDSGYQSNGSQGSPVQGDTPYAAAGHRNSLHSVNSHGEGGQTQYQQSYTQGMAYPQQDFSQQQQPWYPQPESLPRMQYPQDQLYAGAYQQQQVAEHYGYQQQHPDHMYAPAGAWFSPPRMPLQGGAYAAS
ncbi:kinase-like domain-containing protein [Hyaloraphidium curvatum]|nr:kinase-like domain-containing protein [Hyaloraphidium curvatum]